ncbi:MAG TPA: anti-sigma factor [Gemmatimonadaceae bacterium]|nr:anti-sigma factor [Gemmatimonadaceae bacterium]
MMSAAHIAQDALSAYIDGELPADRAQETADHLTTCAHCSGEYEAMLDTIGALHARLERHQAPDVLRARVRAAIASTPREAADVGKFVPRRTRSHWFRAAGIAATLVVGAALGTGITLLARSSSPAVPSIASEVLASHVRSLMPDHLTDVRSSDQHNVKPWFNGRLDYSPTVPRLDEQGFPLIGGRLDYVGDRPVAVVVYGRRQHMINVYSWPTRAPDSPVASEARNGYNMLHWRSGGTERWVISDLNAGELRGFANLLMSGL